MTLSRLLQSENADSPILLTFFGITNPFRPLQPINDDFPIMRTLSGMVSPVRLLQFKNADSPIESNPSGKSMLCRFLHSENAPPEITLIPRESVICFNADGSSFLSLEHTEVPTVLTLPGIVKSVRLVQPEKTYFPIPPIPSESVTSVRLLQFRNK